MKTRPPFAPPLRRRLRRLRLAPMEGVGMGNFPRWELPPLAGGVGAAQPPSHHSPRLRGESARLRRAGGGMLGALALAAILGGCGDLRWPGLHYATMEEGNIYSQAQIDKLRPGLSREEVLHILGSPQLKDPFHADRWDYYYSKRGERLIERKWLSLRFEGERLVDIQQP